VNDLQNLDANNAIERYYRYVGPNGRRQDSAHRYLHPKLQSGEYPNLHVLVEKKVVKVLFDDNKRAVGVEYQSNPKYLANPEFLATAYTALRTVRARKMVVVSAGANATPGILERSGVGDPQVLEQAGIPVVEDLPGVGSDYQDHHLSLWAYRSNLTPRETINGFQDGRFNIDDAIKNTDELLGTNAMDAQGKFRPTEAEVEALGPEFKKAWDRDFKDVPDRPLMILALYCWYGVIPRHSCHHANTLQLLRRSFCPSRRC
jgi:alcohol oxidase